jgi:negative regulator of flagellin synthesis FlgM
MTDAISNNAANAANLLKAAARTAESTSKANVDAADVEEIAPAPAKVEPSSVEISPALQNSLAEADFDAEKVEQIKAALEQGNYPLNDRKIAESFVPLEKLL